MPTTGELIRAARRRRRMTQKELALAAGWSESAVRFVESDRVSPTADKLVTIAGALGYDIVWKRRRRARARG